MIIKQTGINMKIKITNKQWNKITNKNKYTYRTKNKDN